MILLIVFVIIILLCLCKRKTCFFNPKRYKKLYNLHYYFRQIAKEANQIKQVSDFKRDKDDWSEMNNPDLFLDKLGENEAWFYSWDTSDKIDGRDNWLNYHLIFYDQIVGNADIICPFTINLLKNIKGIRIAGFSKLKAHSKLYPHTDSTGLSTNSLAYHLGLTGHAQFYMNNEMKEHAPGKMIIADTNNEHYVINESEDDRIILYIDFDLDRINT